MSEEEELTHCGENTTNPARKASFCGKKQKFLTLRLG